MSRLFIAIFLVAPVWADAQAVLVPSNTAFEKKWVKENIYTMTWSFLRDSTKIAMGTVTTQTFLDSKHIIIVSNIELANSKGKWVDSTIADARTLKPLRHSSYNMQRDMVLDFAAIVSGFYFDKIKNDTIVIQDKPAEGYFDSNLYPSLIGWLPLKEGYRATLSIYDFNPASKSGILKAMVREVRSGSFPTRRSGTRDVWLVTVFDEISNGLSTYYFDKEDRRLWRQDIEVGGRKMIMELKE